MQRKRIVFVTVAATLLLATLIYYFCTCHTAPLAYSGTIETREINIGSKIGGRVTQVFVEEGQQVAANAPLVNFDAPELEAQLSQAQATVAQNAADYNRLQQGNCPQEIAEADATLPGRHLRNPHLPHHGRTSPRPMTHGDAPMPTPP